MKTKIQQLCVLGIGDGGIRPAHYLATNGVEAIYLGIGNTGKRIMGINMVLFNSPKQEFIPGVTRFLVPDMSVEPALPSDVEALVNNDFHFLLFAGLGGYIGTKLTAAVIDQLIQRNKSFTCIVSFPFRFEGKSRAQNAGLFTKQYGNHRQIKVFHLDELCRHTDLLLRQAFTFATLKMAEMAKIELGLKMEIEFPEYEKGVEKARMRAAKLQLLSNSIKKKNN